MRRHLHLLALPGWVVLVVLARHLGRDLATMRGVAVGAAPVVGRWVWHPGREFAVPVALGVVAIVLGPTLARRLPWRTLLVVTWLAAAGWAVALAATDGLAAIPAPLETRYEYLAALPAVDELGVATFVDTYTDRLAEYPTHVKGHPPAATLVYVGLDRAGLGGPGWAAALTIGVGASGAAAVLVAARAVAGASIARRAAPFVAFAPAAVWAGTSVDFLFAGAAAWTIALFVVATRDVSDRAVWISFAAGVVGAVALHLSYGIAPLLAVPATVIVFRRRWDLVAPGVAGALVVTVLFVIAGFWWLDGLGATRELYEAGVSQRRPYDYFVFVANPAALALALGPVGVTGLAALRNRRLAWLVVPVAAALLVAGVSGLSKGEVERIWLPFVPWLLLATAALVRDSESGVEPGDDEHWPDARRDALVTRGWLGLHVAAGVVLQAWLVSPW